MSFGKVSAWAGMVVGFFFGSAHAAELELRLESMIGPFVAGDTVAVGLWVADIDSTPVAGYQAFLEFDDGALTLLSSAYTPAPFSLPVIAPIAVTGNLIDLAAGIDVINGQPTVAADARLAVLTFLATADFCVPPVSFRAHVPPTRLSDPLGEEILPLNLALFPLGLCPGDLDGSGIVDLTDLLGLLAAWGTSCPADLDGDGDTNLNDLLILLANWGPCP